MPPPILVCSTPSTAPPALWTDAAGRAVTLQRPRTDKQKTFTGFDAVACSTEELAAAVAPHVREAVAQGTSLLVAALGAPASGKSTSMRSSGGVAMTAAREIFDALSSAQNNHSVETLVVVSGVVAAIALPTDGKTPLTGKQPTRERLLDALLPAAVPQPAAGLNTRMSTADGLPHAAAHEVEGVTQAVVRSRAELEALVAQCLERCALEERRAATLRAHLLLTVSPPPPPPSPSPSPLPSPSLRP